MDRSAEFQTIIQIMSNQDIQIKHAKEKADNAIEEANKWTNTYNTLVNSKKATQLLLNKEYSKRLHDLTENTQENAVEEPKVDINVEFDNGEKVEEPKVEESAEVSVEEEVAVPCAESDEVIDNSGVMTQENAIFGKKESNKA